jgi:hypothetical protein
LTSAAEMQEHRAPRRRVLWLSTAAFTLGGFFLPPAFGLLGRWSGIPQFAFLPLLGLTLLSLVWLHLAVMSIQSMRSATIGSTRAARRAGARAAESAVVVSTINTAT